MKPSMIRLFNVALIVALVVVAGLKAVTWARPQVAPGGPATPDRWVPFTASIEISHPGTAGIFGTFVQGSDGSSRQETGPAPGDVRVIDIKNVARVKSYRYHSALGWVEQPMRIIRDYGAPARLGPGILQRAQPITYETLEALNVSWPDGRIETMVPALNNFVVDSILPNGKRTRYINVKVIGDVPSGTFEPPAGVQLQYREEPAGIIQHDRSEFEVDADGKVTWKTKK